MKLHFILLSILPLFIIGSSCKNNLTFDDKAQKVLEKGLEKYNAKGASAAVIFPDGKLWTGVSGISYDTVKIQPEMVFAIGSVTKNVVAALTLKLAEAQALSLEQPISHWLPDHPHIDPDITIRQLLNHTSGLYMFWENDGIWRDLQNHRAKYFSPEEVLDYIKEPYFSPGEGWRYSNTNYLLLGMIIEKATGSALSQELRNRFWQPLGINNVWLSQQDGIPVDQMAHIYGDDNMFGQGETDLTYEPRVSHESITFASSGIFIAAKDLAHWCHELFEGNIVSQPFLNEMLRFEEFMPVANMSAYGLGVQKFRKNLSQGKLAIGHAGGNIGSTTYMMYLPEYHVSIVVVLNAFPNEGAEYITKGLTRNVLKELGAIGVIPYIPFLPTGLIIVSAVIFATVMTNILIRKKLRSKAMAKNQAS